MFKKASFLTLALSLVASNGLLLSTSSVKAETVIELTKQSSTRILKSQEPKAFISPRLNLKSKSSEMIRVIVQLSNQPIAVGNYAAKIGISSLAAESTKSSISAQQTSFAQEASSRGIQFKTNYKFDTVLNGMEITIPASQIQELSNIPGVVSVYENSTYYAIPADNPPGQMTDKVKYDDGPLKQIGADYAWANGLTGKGVKVGVIDTGVDYFHPDLEDAYAGGYDSYYKTKDPYEEKPDLDPARPFVGTYHGTHVAGTIAGRAANPTSEIVQKGVAYEAEMHNYKVLGRDDKGKATGSSAQVIDGIERAVKDGMNVINLSLGSDSAKDPNSPDSLAINNAVLSGVVAVVASGNAGDKGPYYYSMGSPASAMLAISVGAVTSPFNHYSTTVQSSLIPPAALKPSHVDSLIELTPIVPSRQLEPKPIIPDPPVVHTQSVKSPKDENLPVPSTSPNPAPVGGGGSTTPPSTPPGVENPPTAPTTPPNTETPPIVPTTPPSTETPPIVPTTPPVTPAVPITELAAPAVNLDHNLQTMGWETGKDDFAAILGSEPIDAVYAGLGDIPDYASINAKDKVVFVSRGSLAFVDKVKNAKSHGAKAIVIFNGINKVSETVPDLSENINGRDSFANVSIGDNFDFIPTFDMEGKAGRKLAKELTSTPGTSLKFTFNKPFNKTIIAGDDMAAFSSRGPESDNNFSIKPDFTAPGVNILSTWPAYKKYFPDASYDKAYDRISGTSMATPHVAGLAVLLKQKHPEWTPFDVRAALANTSEQISNTKGVMYDVYSQGAGRVNIKNALQTPALLQTIDSIEILDKNLVKQKVTNYNSSASFGLMKAGEAGKLEKLQLKNISGKSVSYAASIKMHEKVTSDPAKPIDTPDINKITAVLGGLDNGNQITVGAGQTKPFSLTVNPNADAVNGVYEGEVVLTSAGDPTLHLPFVVNVGTKMPTTGFALQDMALTNDYIVTNGTKDQKTTDISFQLNANNYNLIMVEVYGFDEKRIGTMGEYTDRDPATGKLKMLTPGKYNFKDIDETYYNFVDGKEIKGTLKEGNQYILSVLGAQIDSQGDVVKDAAGKDIISSVEKVFGVKTIKTTPTPTPNPGDNNTGGGGGGSSTGGGTTTTPTPAPASNGSSTSVVNQGQAVVNVNASVSKSGNTVTAKVSDSDLQNALNKNPKSPAALVVNVPVKGNELLNFTLTPAQVAKLQSGNQDNSVVISNGSASLALPVSALKNVPAGAGVNVTIGSADDQSAKFTSKLPGTKILSTPVSFEVNVVNGTTSSPLDVSSQIFIKRAFNVSGDINTDNAGVLYLTGDDVNGVPATITRNLDGTKTVTVSRPGFSTYALATRPVAFTDISTSWAQSRIQGLANKFLLFGTTDTTFSPTKDVTRAEFAAMLTRALGLQAKGTSKFSDVTPTDWFAGSVAAAYEAGLINGVGNDKFDPNAVISRQDLAVMVARTLKLLNVPTKSLPGREPYADMPVIAPYAQESIKTLTENGLIAGVKTDDATLFLPTQSTTREAAASVIYFLLQKGNLIN